MKFHLRVFAVVSALCFSLAWGQEVDEARKALDDAKSFARAGEFAKALERHEWFHENALRIDPAYTGVRLSFALSDWKKLADQYPPALVSLKAIRDADVEKIRAGTGSFGTFHDIFGINKTLGEDAATVSLFKELHAGNPALAKKCFGVVQNTLLDQDEIDLFFEYAGDLSKFMSGEIARHRQMTGFLKSRPGPALEASIKGMEENLVDTALRVIKAADQKGDAATAAKIREMTLEVADDPRLKSGE